MSVEVLLITSWLVKGFVTTFAGNVPMFVDEMIIQFSNCVEQRGTLNTSKQTVAFFGWFSLVQTQFFDM